MALRLFASFLAGIVLLAAAAPAQAQALPYVFPLDGAPGVRGLGTIAAESGDARHVQLTLEIQGLVPGVEYVAHVHAGTVQQSSGSTGTLGRMTADAQGRGRLETSIVQVSASGAGVDLSLDWLADGDHFVDLHDASSVVASGAIPVVRTPIHLPRSGGLPSVAVLVPGLALAILIAIALRSRPRSI